jgi:hypothetical protein
MLSSSLSLDNYERGDSSKYKSSWALQQFLPDKIILGKVFWSLIQNQPLEIISYSVAIMLEDIAKVVISGLMLFPV